MPPSCFKLLDSRMMLRCCLLLSPEPLMFLALWSQSMLLIKSVEGNCFSKPVSKCSLAKYDSILSLIINVLMHLRYSFHFPLQWVMQSTIGGMLLVHLKATSNTLTTTQAGFVVFLVCLFVMAFAWSWGPLGWLIPSETFPLETRTAGFAFAVSSNMFFTFLIAQAFLSMMCHMRAYIFFFFAGWILVMGLFALFLLPETKGVPIDVMVERVWKKHPVWKRFMDDWWWEWQVKANRLVYLEINIISYSCFITNLFSP